MSRGFDEFWVVYGRYIVILLFIVLAIFVGSLVDELSSSDGLLLEAEGICSSLVDVRGLNDWRWSSLVVDDVDLVESGGVRLFPLGDPVVKRWGFDEVNGSRFLFDVECFVPVSACSLTCDSVVGGCYCFDVRLVSYINHSEVIGFGE